MSVCIEVRRFDHEGSSSVTKQCRVIVVFAYRV